MIRYGYVVTTMLAAMSVATGGLVPMPIKVIWNATPSVPVGFYVVEPVEGVKLSELVVVKLPEPLENFMVARGYVGRGVPLLKRVVGLPGQRVCRVGLTITVDGATVADALERDRTGRDLPIWQGCRVIAEGEVFVMNWQVKDSLDGRYFGPISARSIIGRALPLWTDEAGTSNFVWRAQAH